MRVFGVIGVILAGFRQENRRSLWHQRRRKADRRIQGAGFSLLHRLCKGGLQHSDRRLAIQEATEPSAEVWAPFVNWDRLVGMSQAWRPLERRDRDGLAQIRQSDTTTVERLSGIAGRHTSGTGNDDAAAESRRDRGDGEQTVETRRPADFTLMGDSNRRGHPPPATRRSSESGRSGRRRDRLPHKITERVRNKC